MEMMQKSNVKLTTGSNRDKREDVRSRFHLCLRGSLLSALGGGGVLPIEMQTSEKLQI